MSRHHAMDARFNSTNWSVVLSARRWPAREAGAALAQLCEIYWYPLYAFVRRRGYAAHDAQDLTQAFFAHMIERVTLQRVDEGKGKFRTFLLAALTCFLQNEWSRQHTQKRGGDRQIIALDAISAEERYALEPACPAAPAALFDRRWAAAVVTRTLVNLQREYTASDKANVFATLEHCLTGEPDPGVCAKVAPRLGLTEGAVKVSLHRLRRRFGELLRAEISRTVAQPADVDEEIRHLFAAFTG